MNRMSTASDRIRTVDAVEILSLAVGLLGAVGRLQGIGPLSGPVGRIKELNRSLDSAFVGLGQQDEFLESHDL